MSFRYHRTTDDDNTASLYHDRQFYVNHEARYQSHELQAFYEINDTMSVTSGVFWYEALIDQRGDFYSEVGSQRMQNAYEDNTVGFLLGGAPMATLFSAKMYASLIPTYNPANETFLLRQATSLSLAAMRRAWQRALLATTTCIYLNGTEMMALAEILM